ERYRSRQLYQWAPDVTLLRTNEEENALLGRELAAKLNRSKGPAVVYLPARGISQIDAEGGIFYQPRTDRVLFENIRLGVGPQVPVVEVDAHINDLVFSEQLVSALLTLLEGRTEKHQQ